MVPGRLESDGMAVCQTEAQGRVEPEVVLRIFLFELLGQIVEIEGVAQAVPAYGSVV